MRAILTATITVAAGYAVIHAATNIYQAFAAVLP